MYQARQGDLLIVEGAIPQGAEPVKSGIVELGEATGHAHVLQEGEVFESWGEQKFLRSAGAALLVHDEHETIALPEGEYRVIRQRQYDGENQWSNVID